MYIMTDFDEEGTVSIHSVPNADFVKIKARMPNPVISLDKQWLLTTFVGKVEINYYSDKVFCRSCHEKYQDSPEVEVCEDCFEFIEEEERREQLRQRREDRYDESRGH